MAQIFMGLFMVLYYIMFIKIFMSLMKGLSKAFVIPKLSGEVKIEQGNCIDHVTLDFMCNEDKCYYAILNWSNYALVTSDADVINPDSVVIHDFSGKLDHEFDIYPETFPQSFERSYKFTVEVGVCLDKECNERKKVIVKDGWIRCVRSEAVEVGH